MPEQPRVRLPRLLSSEVFYFEVTHPQVMRLVPFKQRLTSALPSGELFEELVKAFEDSRDSPVWPQVGAYLQARERPLREGSEVEAAYTVGPWRSAVPYRVAVLDRKRLRLRYEAVGKHPLRGGATIQVRQRPGGSTLLWEGSWRARGLLGIGPLLWFKGWYEPRFFHAFAARIRH